MTMTKTASRSRSAAASESKAPISAADEESHRLATAQALKTLIEEERIRLMKAEAVLECAMLAMDETDFEQTHGPYYQNVIGVARDLILHSIDQLDSLRLAPLIDRLTGRTGPGVREHVTAYLH
jgi:hypothetical protein